MVKKSCHHVKLRVFVCKVLFPFPCSFCLFFIYIVVLLFVVKKIFIREIWRKILFLVQVTIDQILDKEGTMTFPFRRFFLIFLPMSRTKNWGHSRVILVLFCAAHQVWLGLWKFLLSWSGLGGTSQGAKARKNKTNKENRGIGSSWKLGNTGSGA